MIGFALCHGWSFDASAMHALAEALRTQFPQAPVAVFDLGFTGKSCAPLLAASDADTKWIACGHSYGFAYLMQQALPWHAAISVNGFTRFCRRPGKPEGTPARLVDAMIARLESDTQAMLMEFRQRCAGAQTLPEWFDVPCDMPLDLPHLCTHLKQLRDLDLPAPAFPVLSLSTREDLIVPPALTHACFTHTGYVMQQYEGNHLTLLQEPQQCMAAIVSFIEANGA